jgi:hypothetical protein
MAGLNGFNAATVDPTDNYGVVPNGDYIVAITDSEERQTKAGTGSYINLTMEIIDGPHKGSKVFDLLNLNNPNPKAVEIAQRALSQICHAVGVLTPNDTVELHGKPLMAKIIVKDDPQYGPKNEVKKYSAAGAPTAAAPVAEAAAAPTPAPIASAAPQVAAPSWAQ